MATLGGYPFDADEFHRMLAVSYAETERRAAALEHLRSGPRRPVDLLDLAALATKCRLPEEAARFFRGATAADPAVFNADGIDPIAPGLRRGSGGPG